MILAESSPNRWKTPREKEKAICNFSVSHGVFSSPKYNVLRVSYCDRSLSGLRPCDRPSVRELLLEKSSRLKPADRFQWNFTEMIYGWCTFRILQRYEFSEELWLPWQPKENTYGPGVEISPMLWVLGFDIEIKKEIFKNLLVSNRKGYSFDIWHVASSSGPQPKYFKLWPWSRN